MHHYVAREIIRQRTGEMRAQARRDATARQAREARHNQEAGLNQTGLNRAAGQPQETPRPGRDDRDQGPAAEVIPMPRVPDYADGTCRDAGPRAHAC